MMIVPAGVKVHLALGYTDTRKGMDGLAALVQEQLKRDPFICVRRDYVSARSESSRFHGEVGLCRHIILRFRGAVTAPLTWV